MKDLCYMGLAALFVLLAPRTSHAQIVGCSNPLNFVTNGDFSAGATGFTTQYDTYTIPCREGEFRIVPNTTQKCTTWTASTGFGDFMMIDSYNPAVLGDSNIWQQTISGITPNTTYTIRIRKIDIYGNTEGLNVKINGTTVETDFADNGPGGANTWAYHTTTWNSGSTSGSITLAFSNDHVNRNDYGVDDIFFGVCGDCSFGDGEIIPKVDKLGCTYDFSVSINTSPGMTIVGYLWDFGDGTSSTDPTPQHTYTTSGTYVVCVTIVGLNALGDCCTRQICTEVFVECSSGKRALPPPNDPGSSSTGETSLQLFPNPTSGALNVVWEHAGEAVESTVHIYDRAGREVNLVSGTHMLQPGTNQFTVPTDGLEPGIYFLRLDVAGEPHTQRFVVLD